MSPQLLRECIVQLEKQKVQKEAELDKAGPSVRSKSISLQQQKKSANCSTEATANAGMKGPEICPETAVVSAPVTVHPSHQILPPPLHLIRLPSAPLPPLLPVPISLPLLE